MGGSYAGLVIELLAVFLGGVVLGVVARVSLAIRREERRRSLFGPAPDAATRSARWLTRFGVHDAAVAQRSRGQQA